MSDTVSKKTYAEGHTEQDPAEGSREVVDRDLKQEGGKEAAREKDKPRGE